MHARSRSILAAAWFICAGSAASCQSPAAGVSDLDRSIGHWVASGVSFQSGNAARHFAVDVKRADSQLEITLPAEVKLAAGQVYALARTRRGVFRHVDSVSGGSSSSR